MLKEQENGTGLVPIKKVAEPRLETEDSATRRMIAQMQKSLLPRFPLQSTGRALEIRQNRFVELMNGVPEQAVNLFFRVTDKEYRLLPDQNIELVTGMCLFGASGLMGKTEMGSLVSLTDPYEIKAGFDSPVTEVLVNENLHASETETILRITETLKLLAKIQTESNQTAKIRCAFHMPTVEYKLYMVDLCQRGLLSEAQVVKLASLIDKRAQGLEKLLIKRTPFKTEFGSPIQELDNLLATKGVGVSLADCVQVLSQDPLMAELIRIKQPQTLIELNELSYAAGYFRVSEKARQTNQGCLAVDISEEMPIFDNAKSLAQQGNLPLQMAALYVQPFTVTQTGRYGKPGLFMHLSQAGSNLDEQRIVLNNSRERTA